LHVARANNKHGVDLGFLGFLDFAVDLVSAAVAFDTNHKDERLRCPLAHVGRSPGLSAFPLSYRE
jgi:hypothetical protein